VSAIASKGVVATASGTTDGAPVVATKITKLTVK
jgi:hypothetical protein